MLRRMPEIHTCFGFEDSFLYFIGILISVFGNWKKEGNFTSSLIVNILT